MKSLLTRNVSQSWLLISVLGSILGCPPIPALSIPEEVIVQKLQSVPVYTILDRLNKFVSTGNENGTGTKIDLFFKSEDAIRALSASLWVFGELITRYNPGFRWGVFRTLSRLK